MSFSSFIAFGKVIPGAKRWFRRVFYDDWSVKLLALAITLVLWFVVTGHEPQIERELTVEPRIAGTPAPGYEVSEILATPPKIRVQGPASHLSALQKAPTQTISIEGRRETFDVPQTAIYIPDPRVDVRDTVSVHVEIVPVGSAKPLSRDTN